MGSPWNDVFMCIGPSVTGQWPEGSGWVRKTVGGE